MRVLLRSLTVAVSALLAASCGPATREPGAAPLLAGLARPGPEARVRGQVLLGELGCTACHLTGADREPVDRRPGPDLAEVGARVDPAYLEAFLADPRGVEPGTAMPDLLGPRPLGERRDLARALAHFLRARSTAVFVRAPADPAAAERGRTLFDSVGCVACHAARADDGAELPMPASVPLGRVDRKYGPDGLRAFLLAPHQARPGRRMPDLGLSPQEAHDLAHFLTLPAGPDPGTPVPPVDPALAERGRALFDELRCAACHEGLGSAEHRPVPALDELELRAGCLSAEPGDLPDYDLSAAQRADLRVALAATAPWSDAERIEVRLLARHCLACHERDGRGGVGAERAAFFQSEDQGLGEPGRVPPPLTGAGAKLNPAWLAEAIAHGQRARPYLRTRMPGFGPDLGAELAALFAAVDPLPPTAVPALPADRDEAQAVRELGRQLTGDQGMNCIACHAFAGERVGSMAAVDLVESTAARLRPEWFHAYLLEPARFRPGTLMPQFFIDGVSTRTDLADGDPARQIAALWHYLAEGRNVRKPQGLRPEPIGLEVGETAVILRRALQHTGKRGIAVGYPGGVNIGFDAESLALNQIWWGPFLDVAPVFHGQGSGQARIPSRDHALLGAGPVFAELGAADADWPAETRRELGQRFVGYDLDEGGRPTFRYECAGVAIEDRPREFPASPRPALRRSIRFRSERAVTLWFRAALGPRIDDLGGGLIRVGEGHGGHALRIVVPADAQRIVGAGEARELRIRVEVPPGETSLELEYRWQEEGR
jgi:cytochrome c2